MPAGSAKWLPRLLLAGLCLAWAADGAAGTRVQVIVLAHPGTPLGSRLRAELVHLGFAVEERDDGDPLQLIRELVREQREGAVMRIETALREDPSGPLARETLGRTMEARSRSGDADGARALARQYLQRYPKGPHAAFATRLLKESP